MKKHIFLTNVSAFRGQHQTEVVVPDADAGSGSGMGVGGQAFTVAFLNELTMNALLDEDGAVEAIGRAATQLVALFASSSTEAVLREAALKTLVAGFQKQSGPAQAALKENMGPLTGLAMDDDISSGLRKIVMKAMGLVAKSKSQA